jgi:predicted nucleotidyltransferase
LGGNLHEQRYSDKRLERKAIVDAVRSINKNATVWLFGSRTDIAAKGGDIDIAVLSDKIGIPDKLKIKRCIMDAIGEQKIDFIIRANYDDPFFSMVVASGVKLAG